MMAEPIYKLAGQQKDPLVEEIIAIIGSDQPTRSTIRPKDSRRHWQWWARDPRGNTSRVWVSYGQPITDETPAELKSRTEAALAVLVPAYARKIEVEVNQISFDEMQLDVLVDGAVVVSATTQGGLSA